MRDSSVGKWGYNGTAVQLGNYDQVARMPGHFAPKVSLTGTSPSGQVDSTVTMTLLRDESQSRLIDLNRTSPDFIDYILTEGADLEKENAVNDSFFAFSDSQEAQLRISKFGKDFIRLTGVSPAGNQIDAFARIGTKHFSQGFLELDPGADGVAYTGLLTPIVSRPMLTRMAERYQKWLDENGTTFPSEIRLDLKIALFLSCIIVGTSTKEVPEFLADDFANLPAWFEQVFVKGRFTFGEAARFFEANVGNQLIDLLREEYPPAFIEVLEIKPELSALPLFVDTSAEAIDDALLFFFEQSKTLGFQFWLNEDEQFALDGDSEDWIDFEARLIEFGERLSNQIHYLGPLRVDGQSTQVATQKIDSILPLGAKGELMATALLKRDSSFLESGGEARVSTLRPASLYPLPDGSKTDSLKEAFHSWVQYLGFGRSVSFPDVGARGRGVEIDGVELMHLGTGVSQTLPVIAICLLANPGSLTIIEQPELHLHPDAQQRIADFFIEISKSGRMLMVETHSEYVINRVRRAVVMNDAVEQDIQLFFAERGDDGTEIREGNINGSGGFNYWPKGFFGQTEDDLLDILEALTGEE